MLFLSLSLSLSLSLCVYAEMPKERVCLYFSASSYHSLMAVVSPSITFLSVAGSVWKVLLDPVEEAGPFTITATLEGQPESIALTDVLFGDVWVCAGQTNMQYSIGYVSTEVIYIYIFPPLRSITIPISPSSSLTSPFSIIFLLPPFLFFLSRTPNFHVRQCRWV